MIPTVRAPTFPVGLRYLAGMRYLAGPQRMACRR